MAPNDSLTPMNLHRSSKSGCAKPVAIAAALVFAAQAITGHALAQGSGRPLSLIRDAEIEQLVRDYISPLLKVSQVNSGATKIFLVGDRSFNAFVAEGRNIFINAGALMETETPNEIIGVLAHEIAHIAGGHLVRQRMQLDRAAIMAVAGMLLSAGALAGTARNRQVGMEGNAPAGIMLGPQEIIRRSLLAYQRSEEQAADIAAVKYLSATHQSAQGLLKTLERFNKQALFASSQLDPYLLSHPLPAERMSFLSEAARQSSAFHAKDPPARQARHDLVRAKLVAFLADGNETNRRYPLSDASLAARYARAISAYRFGRVNDAISQIDQLIATQPANAYFHELKGQTLLEAGRAAQAIAPLKRAVALAPSAAPIRVMLGHALVSSGSPQGATEAIPILNRVTQQEQENGDAFQYLAMAYERKGDQPMAQLSAAQALFLAGRYVEARTQASRAQKQFQQGTTGWLKADDILNYRPPKD